MLLGVSNSEQRTPHLTAFFCQDCRAHVSTHSMTITEVQGVSPQVATYLDVVSSAGPLSEARVQELRVKILAVVAADDSLDSFPDLLMFDDKLLDAVAAALRLVVYNGEGEQGVARERVSRANEKLGAIAAVRAKFEMRQHTRQIRGGTKVCDGSRVCR